MREVINSRNVVVILEVSRSVLLSIKGLVIHNRYNTRTSKPVMSTCSDVGMIMINQIMGIMLDHDLIKGTL